MTLISKRNRVLRKKRLAFKKNMTKVLNAKRRTKELGRRIACSQCFIFTVKYCCTNKQIILLQQVSRLLYLRVPYWINTVRVLPKIRRSDTLLSFDSS